MSHRDYEEQPEAPDLAEVVQEDTADTLVGPPDSDVLDAGYVPPDRPYVQDDEETLRREESLDRKLDRERADVAPTGPSDPTGGPDREPDRAPRLRAAEPTAAGGYTDPVRAEGVGVDGGAASAEEAAMHVRDPESPADDSDHERDTDEA
jgi:hypothetical protein